MGIYDRDYYRQGRSGFRLSVPRSAVGAIIVLNVAVFLIEIAGGEDILPKLRFQQAAKDRIISPELVRASAPDVILASWCGKKMVPDRIRKRPGWSEIPAVRASIALTRDRFDFERRAETVALVRRQRPESGLRHRPAFNIVPLPDAVDVVTALRLS